MKTMNIKMAFAPSDRVYLLHKGKIRTGEVLKVNGRVVEDLSFEITSVTIRVEPSQHYNAEETVIDNGNTRNISQWIFKTEEAAVASILAEITAEKEYWAKALNKK